jgi:hypothetical protein
MAMLSERPKSYAWIAALASIKISGEAFGLAVVGYG